MATGRDGFPCHSALCVCAGVSLPPSAPLCSAGASQKAWETLPEMADGTRTAPSPVTTEVHVCHSPGDYFCWLYCCMLASTNCPKYFLEDDGGPWPLPKSFDNNGPSRRRLQGTWARHSSRHGTHPVTAAFWVAGWETEVTGASVSSD